MLKRNANWPEALAAEIARAWAKPFTWGENDCCLFACDCALAMTGTDMAASLRGYRDYEVAQAVVKRYGIAGIAPLRARRGDICLIDIGRGETLGVCAGDRILCPGLRGLVAYPLLNGIRAWEIG